MYKSTLLQRSAEARYFCGWKNLIIRCPVFNININYPLSLSYPDKTAKALPLGMGLKPSQGGVR